MRKGAGFGSGIPHLRLVGNAEFPIIKAESVEVVVQEGAGVGWKNGISRIFMVRGDGIDSLAVIISKLEVWRFRHGDRHP